MDSFYMQDINLADSHIMVTGAFFDPRSPHQVTLVGIGRVNRFDIYCHFLTDNFAGAAPQIARFKSIYGNRLM